MKALQEARSGSHELPRQVVGGGGGGGFPSRRNRIHRGQRGWGQEEETWWD